MRLSLVRGESRANTRLETGKIFSWGKSIERDSKLTAAIGGCGGESSGKNVDAPAARSKG